MIGTNNSGFANKNQSDELDVINGMPMIISELYLKKKNNFDTDDIDVLNAWFDRIRNKATSDKVFERALREPFLLKMVGSLTKDQKDELKEYAGKILEEESQVENAEEQLNDNEEESSVEKKSNSILESITEAFKVQMFCKALAEKSRSCILKEMMAGFEYASPEALAILATVPEEDDPQHLIRQGVAKNPNTYIADLYMLADNELKNCMEFFDRRNGLFCYDRAILEGLISNKNTPISFFFDKRFQELPEGDRFKIQIREALDARICSAYGLTENLSSEMRKNYNHELGDLATEQENYLSQAQLIYRKGENYVGELDRPIFKRYLIGTVLKDGENGCGFLDNLVSSMSSIQTGSNVERESFSDLDKALRMFGYGKDNSKPDISHVVSANVVAVPKNELGGAELLSTSHRLDNPREETGFLRGMRESLQKSLEEIINRMGGRSQ